MMNQLLYSEYILVGTTSEIAGKKYMYQISHSKTTCLILYLFLSSYQNSFDLSGHGQGTPEGGVGHWDAEGPLVLVRI